MMEWKQGEPEPANISREDTLNAFLAGWLRGCFMSLPEEPDYTDIARKLVLDLKTAGFPVTETQSETR